MVEQVIEHFGQAGGLVDNAGSAHRALARTTPQSQHVFGVLREQTREISRTPANKRRTS
ncbi:hypothetical protein [Streptomyces sp. KR55]|uniref:hypothetical protein n=1 Tax=Streptomyces sp. KR55 TaxID=3457425 RepID=UPI003FCFD138